MTHWIRPSRASKVTTGPAWVEVALGVVLRRIEGAPRLLISRRTSDQVLAEYWEFPGGKIEPGETPRACVVRELREEVGLDVKVARALLRIEHHYPHASVRLHAFLCELLAGEAQPLQVASCRWVKPEELSRFTFAPANAVLLEHLRRRRYG